MEASLTNRLKHHLDMQEIETQASPSFLNNSEKRQTRSRSSAKVQENILYISQMIEKIKGLSRRKRGKRNNGECDTCHSCNAVLETEVLIQCNQEECKRYFCFRCLNKKFNKTAKDIYDITLCSHWNCVSCQGHCTCKGCKDRSDEDLIEFPSKQMLFKQTRKNKKNIPLKVEYEEEFTDDMVKKEFVDSVSVHVPVDYSIKQKIEEYTRDLEITKIEGKTVIEETQLYIPPKPRSKALAKKFREQRIRDPSTSDLSFEEEAGSESQDTPASLEENKLDKLNKNVPFKIDNNQSRNKLECHMCHNGVNSSRVATCSIESCRKHYCIDCIKQTYQQDFELSQNYNPAYWVCFSCGGTCECQKCKRRRDAGKRRTNEILNAQEELYSHLNRSRGSKMNEKRRVKYYDTLSEEEEERQREGHFKLSSLDNGDIEDIQQIDIQRKQVKIGFKNSISPNLLDSDKGINGPTRGHFLEAESDRVGKQGQEKENPGDRLILRKKRLGKSQVFGI